MDRSKHKDVDSEALLCIAGPTPLHLRLQEFDLFDGQNWYPSPAPEFPLAIKVVNPIVAFVLSERRGPDYLFASAAAVMLRSLEYPTRLVRGFYASPERFDPESGQTAVLKEDVHFWTQSARSADVAAMFAGNRFLESAAVHADQTMLVGLSFLLRDRRSGFSNRQAQPALQIPRQSGHDHIRFVTDQVVQRSRQRAHVP